MTTTAAIWSDPEWDPIAHVERRRWRVQLSLGAGRRHFARSRREATEWCDERRMPYVIVDLAGSAR